MSNAREPRMQAPARPLPPGYVPTGGVPYKVQDRDSWVTIAARHRVDAWWLIKYNFETRDVDIVNWYLKNRVGCRQTTHDGLNWKFSSGDTPGVIHVPRAETVRALVSTRFSNFGISIEGDDDYRADVEVTLGYIRRADTGMALLNALKRTRKTFTISAWTGSACNATASPDDIEDATPAGEIPLVGGSSFEQRKTQSLLGRLLDLPPTPLIGTGRGSNVVVRFTPSMWGYGSGGPCSPYRGQPGASPSQVLFHELCHGYREAAAHFYTRPTIGGRTSYDNLEEFFAIVLSNVLTSDPTFSVANRRLRADHWGFTELAAPLATSRGFVSVVGNRNLMRELVKTEPDLVKELGGVKSYFNPFIEPL